jgi:hypothetical protein
MSRSPLVMVSRGRLGSGAPALAATLLGILAAAVPVLAGGGYLVGQQVARPAQTGTAVVTEFSQNPSREDVKKTGMGRTGTASDRPFNAMLDNPAFLAGERFAVDLFGIQAGIPGSTVSAARFLRDNQGEFRDGHFYLLLREGREQYGTATSDEERLAAIAGIRQGLSFPRRLCAETVGDPQTPDVHQFNTTPLFQAQWRHWGVSLYGTARIGFTVFPGNSIARLRSLAVPEDAPDLSPEAQRLLGEMVGSVFDAPDDPARASLPQVFAMSSYDVVGVAGYARRVSERLDAGANLKLVHRHFTTREIDAEEFDRLMREAGKNLEESATGFTVDLGILYRDGEPGTQLGLVVQNAIPAGKIASTVRLNSIAASSHYLTDAGNQPLVGSLDPDGGFHPDPGGDTLIAVESQRQTVQKPFALKIPVLVNAGLWRALEPNWDLALDWVDIFAQDNQYGSRLARFRLGTEYRLPKNLFALRAGLAEERPTIGAGLNLKTLQFDAAHGYDSAAGENAFFIQAKLSW